MTKRKSSSIAMQLSVQLDAIRRLARKGDYAGAKSRCAVLRRKYPDYQPLYGLTWEIASYLHNAQETALAALEWTQHSASSQPAWDALRAAAFAANLPALGLQAARRLDEIAGKPFDAPPTSDTPFGPMSFADMVANDTARLLMSEARMDAALAVLAHASHPSARNNVALCRFGQSKIEEALAGFEAAWQDEPRNLFALEKMVRLRLWTRGRGFAAGLATPLKNSRPVRADDALAQVCGLLLLEQWDAADTAWEAAHEADYWQSPFDNSLQARFAYAGGVAALRRDRPTEATRRFAEVNREDGNITDAVSVLARLAQAEPGELPEVKLGELNEWFPVEWARAMRALKDRSTDVAGDIERLLGRCTAHPDYLGIGAELGGSVVSAICIMMLQKRADADDAVARAELIALLARPCGPDEVRAGIHARMVEHGQLAANSVVNMLSLGKVREIKHQAMKIHADVSPPELPPASHLMLENAMDEVHRGNLSAARDIMEGLLQKHPDVATLHANLAGLFEGLRYPDAEVEALLRHAHQLQPDYLFAIAGLARIAARRGDIERCSELLDSIQGRPDYHFTEYRSLLMAQRELALVQGENAAARRIARMIDDLRAKFD